MAAVSSTCRELPLKFNASGGRLERLFSTTEIAYLTVTSGRRTTPIDLECTPRRTLRRCTELWRLRRLGKQQTIADNARRRRQADYADPCGRERTVPRVDPAL